MVEKAAVLVVGEQVRRALPERSFAERTDALLLETHPDRDVGGRVLVALVREARDEPRDLGQPAGACVVQEPALAAARPPVWAKFFQNTNTLSVLPNGTESQ